MPVGQTTLLTVKQEGFCQEVVKGSNLSDAYRAHYSTSNMKPETVNRRAKDVSDKGKIKARIQELRQPAVDETLLTHSEHLKTLEALRDGAQEYGQYGPAITAEVSRGKSAGLYVERIDINAEVKLTGVLQIGGDMSMSEWIQATGGTTKEET
jgi:phage terminase small subunit